MWESEELDEAHSEIGKHKWKLQARTIERKMGPDNGPKNLKRPKKDNCGESQDEKRGRMYSPSHISFGSSMAKSKIRREIKPYEDAEMTAATKVEELTGEAGCQPRQQL